MGDNWVELEEPMKSSEVDTRLSPLAAVVKLCITHRRIWSSCGIFCVLV